MNRKIVLASCVGNALEFYDFTLYGFFTAIITPMFFPDLDPLVSLISGFAVFAVGFMARPFGAIFFGHIGDKWGRKKALSLSIVMMAVPTTAIGLLPSYENAGILAPILLTLCRLVQGFSAGGEYNGAGVFVTEHSPASQRGFWGGLITSSGLIGSLFASLIGILFTLPFMPAWGWRVPFMLGGFMGILGFYIRRRLDESPEFKKSEKSVSSSGIPLFVLLRTEFPAFVSGVVVGALATVPFYMVLSYINSLLLTTQRVSRPEMMSLNALMMAVCIIALPLAGYLSDRVGRKKLMLFGAVGVLASCWPLLYVLKTGTLFQIVAMQILTLIFTEAYVGPSNAFMYDIFSTRNRYTGSAFSYCIGLALLGGVTPYISAHLVHTAKLDYGPAVYMAIVALAAIVVAAKGHSYDSPISSGKAIA